MCKKTTVAYADLIGRRLVGWCLFNGKDYEFFSDKQVKNKLVAGELVNGLKLDGEGNVAIDPEFNEVILGKSGLTFSPFMSGGESSGAIMMGKSYALVKVRKDKGGNIYGFITNRCGYEEFPETQLKGMLAVLDMGGVKLDGKGKVVVHPGVEAGAPEAEKDKGTEKKEGVG